MKRNKPPKRLGAVQKFVPKDISATCPQCGRRTICRLVGYRAQCLHEDCLGVFEFRSNEGDRGPKGPAHARPEQRRHIRTLLDDDDRMWT